MKLLSIALNSAVCYGVVDLLPASSIPIANRMASSKYAPILSHDALVRHSKCGNSMALLNIRLPNHLSYCMCTEDISRVDEKYVPDVLKAVEYAIGYHEMWMDDDEGNHLDRKQIQEKLDEMTPLLVNAGNACKGKRCCPEIVY